MKTLLKRISAMLMVVMLTVTMLPAAAQAAVYAPKSVTVYRPSKTGTRSVYFSVSGLGAKENVSKASVKSSKSSVATMERYYDYKSTSTTHYFNDSKASGNNSHSVEFSLAAKKAGTTTVSYKIGKKSYKTNVIVKNYTNPIKSLKISGIKANLAGKFKSSNNANAALASSSSKGTVTVKAASGWKISSVYLANEYDYSKPEGRINYSMGLYSSSATLYTGALKKGQKYNLNISLVNTKTGGSQYVSLFIK